MKVNIIKESESDTRPFDVDSFLFGMIVGAIVVGFTLVILAGI